LRGRIRSRDFALPTLRQSARQLALLFNQGDGVFVEGDEDV
jgi:hypothetical protein